MSEICPCCGDKLVEMGEYVMCIREDHECGYTASIVSNHRLCNLQAENEKMRAEIEKLKADVLRAEMRADEYYSDWVAARRDAQP